MRTGAVLYKQNEYEGGTLLSIERYFNDFEEPFIKGLFKGKGAKNLLNTIECKQNDILIFMQDMADDFKRNFQGVPLYLYLKREHRGGEPKRSRAFTLIWRIKRSVCGSDDNTMITYLFSGDKKYDYLLKRFGPSMQQRLREYDIYRLRLNMAENLLRHQKKSIQTFCQATRLMHDKHV